MKKRCYPTILSLMLAFTLSVTANETVYEPDYEENVLYLQPLSAYQYFTLTVKGPNDTSFIHHFEGDETPYLTLYDHEGRLLPDGLYTFELRAAPLVSEEAGAYGDQPLELPQGNSQSGSFYLADGQMVLPAKEVKENETPNEALANVIEDNLIVIGNQCVGLGCVTNEEFSINTLSLKQAILRLSFEDTSSGAFPSNDWRLMVNDTASGGMSYFGIEDSTAGTVPFRIMAGAPNNALYVDAAGKVGIGTTTPLTSMHVISGNAPTIRLEQDGSSGLGPQAWDLTSNGANFYIGDATNGNKLPFRIEANSPTNSVYVATDGVGLNTYTPSAQLDVVGTSELNGNVTVTEAGVKLKVEDTSNTANTRFLMGLKNKGPVLMDLYNTDQQVRWYLGVDNRGFKVRNNAPGGVILQLRGDIAEITAQMRVSGATTLMDTLDVIGDTTLGDLTATNVTATGITQLNSMTATGVTNLEGGANVSGGGIAVTGNTILDSAISIGLQMQNTYNRWGISVDNLGLRIWNYIIGGAVLQLKNTGEMTVTTGLGELLRLTPSGDLILSGELQFAGGRALSTEIAAMKQQLQAQKAHIKALSEENEAMNRQLLTRLQALETTSFKRQVSRGKRQVSSFK